MLRIIPNISVALNFPEKTIIELSAFSALGSIIKKKVKEFQGNYKYVFSVVKITDSFGTEKKSLAAKINKLNNPDRYNARIGLLQKSIKANDNIILGINRFHNIHLNSNKLRNKDLAIKISLVILPIVSLLIGFIVAGSLGYGIGIGFSAAAHNLSKITPYLSTMDFFNRTSISGIIFATIAGIAGAIALIQVMWIPTVVGSRSSYNKHIYYTNYYNEKHYIYIHAYIKNKRAYVARMVNELEEENANLRKEIDEKKIKINEKKVGLENQLEHLKKLSKQGNLRKEIDVYEKGLKKIEWVENLKERFTRELGKQYKDLTFDVSIYGIEGLEARKDQIVQLLRQHQASLITLEEELRD